MRRLVKSSTCLPPEKTNAFRRLQGIAKRRALEVTYSHMSGEYIHRQSWSCTLGRSGMEL